MYVIFPTLKLKPLLSEEFKSNNYYHFFKPLLCNFTIAVSFDNIIC